MSNSNLYSSPVFDYPLISVSDLTFAYGERHVLNIPDWQLMHGESIFISGESGSGKTTLISLLAGLLKPTSGNISINANDITTMRPNELNKFRANHVGLISQQFNLIPYLSVIDNILLANSFSDHTKKDVRREALQLLGQLELKKEIADQKASQLSVGQQQRVAIVRALINRPLLLLADEPTSALDADNKQSFMTLLKEMTHEINLSLVFISHDASLAPFFSRSMALTELQSHAD